MADKYILFAWSQIATQVEADTEIEARLRAARRDKVIADESLDHDAWVIPKTIVAPYPEYVIKRFHGKVQARDRRKGDKDAR
jgi:hypothetical protein